MSPLERERLWICYVFCDVIDPAEAAVERLVLHFRQVTVEILEGKPSPVHEGQQAAASDEPRS